ncbi:MAG: type II toxin-antitoxin system RelE/ParE family toxin [Prochloraceae cyanobacterium]|nr:type II toxin-antitoxin system RelE/ParE family toxin [Prochloraceae cyanobacterium]
MTATTFDAIHKKGLIVARFPHMGKAYDNISPGLRGFFVDGYLVLYYPRVDGIEGIDIVEIVSEDSDR